MEKFAKLVLLFGFVFICGIKSSHADVRSWCGVYGEEHNRGYILLLSEDLGIGSRKCNLENYNSRLGDEILVKIGLDFNREKYSLRKWHKFNGHLLELNGKYKNSRISNVRLIRDLGM